ncbi:hypothetical protein [Lysinibacillus sp. BPa_S21]|uniref:hypothetical protein n=1 Tax=Lysinibacillus sp. BPa_S21 TaxID=2932478 RepID=UPI00201323B3|nr:hypothetical protein [Lysinibacillus sp. BPa_S21]MCL1696306.1 hypothetical protein [Lysinibacillus sp. BPa_S21]
MFKKFTDVEDFLVWMAEECGTDVTTVLDTKMRAEGALDAFYEIRDEVEILNRENEILKDKLQLLSPFKKWNCDGCNKGIEVQKDHVSEYCCSGFECGCMGLPINPAFCDECTKKVFGKDSYLDS